MKRVSTTHEKEIRRMLETTTVCLNCGKKLNYLPDKESRRNRGYCSRKCFLSKPPKIAYVEQSSQKSVREILTETLNKTQNVSVSAELVGVSRKQMYEWLEKLDIKRKIMWS